MSNWKTNLPPGCSSDEIERRFGDGDPEVDENDNVEGREESENIRTAIDAAMQEEKK